MTTASFLPPTDIGELLAASLEAFLATAALNLGDATADGRLEHPDPKAAWLALMAASALVIELAPVMNEGILGYYRTAVAGLLDRFTAQHADLPVAAPGATGAVARALEQAGRAVDVNQP